eukprot:COSAG06_NODE_3827_length_4861_cov_61.488450_7_plen_124_part_00
MSVCHACLSVFLPSDCAPVSSPWCHRCVLCVRVCILGSALLPCGGGLLLLILLLLLLTAVPCRFYVSDPLLGVPDGNDTNNQPTQGPRHYDTLTTKLFYGSLLFDNLEDYAAALPVFEEVAEG